MPKTVSSVVPVNVPSLLNRVGALDTTRHPLSNIAGRVVQARGYAPLGKTHVSVKRPPPAYPPPAQSSIRKPTATK